MLVRKVPSRRKSQRGGFTLIELLVVISIIAVLASLILPGIQSARETARRIQCLNNMRNVGMAMQAYATRNNGQLPPLAGGLDYQGTSATDLIPMPWTVHILPFVEQEGLFSRLTSVANRPATEDITALARTRIEVFNCPDDPSGDRGGGLSFVVNGGYATPTIWALSAAGNDAHRISHTVSSVATPVYDWFTTAYTPTTIDSERATLSTGMFWRANSPSRTDYNPNGLRISLDRIPDGSSQTILLTENLDNGGWLRQGNGDGGLNGTGDLAFMLMMPGDDTATAGEPANTVLELGTPGIALGSLVTEPGASTINAFQGQVSAGAAPRPSSFHQDLVNVIFADGSGRPVNETISYDVLARLISSNGNASPYNQPILSGDAF